LFNSKSTKSLKESDLQKLSRKDERRPDRKGVPHLKGMMKER
jgi:hypothetical protein